MKEIDSKTIKHLASLSALRLNEEEAEGMKRDLEGILELVDKIEKCEVPENYKEDSIIKLTDLREDEIKVGLSQEEVLACAPKQRKGYFVVPKVVE
ncbi:MAG: Asp-tRNA(Asn)/Glu-tRNA(Gln) amidotransferase subunit GatC [Clostridia bacterium]|nr:Asp-tRNA(Asn)/Glu-tRNA(Gln) amidotransferase subunit GatC [Clostridia bacterium]